MTVNRKKFNSLYEKFCVFCFLAISLIAITAFCMNSSILFQVVGISVVVFLVSVMLYSTIILGSFSFGDSYRFKVKNGDLIEVLDSRAEVKLGRYHGFTPRTPKEGIADTLSFSVQSKDGHVFHLHSKTLFYHLDDSRFDLVEPFIRKWQQKILKDEPFYKQCPSNEKIITLLQETFSHHTKEELNSKLFLSELVNEALKELNEESFMKVRLYM